MLVLPDGTATDDYQAVNSCMRCSDHSPIHTTLLLTTEPNPADTRAYGCRISLQNMRLCDATGRWTLSPDGEWKDAIDSASDTRPAHVLAPYAPHNPLAMLRCADKCCAALRSAPFEVDGQVPSVHSMTLGAVAPGLKGEGWATIGGTAMAGVHRTVCLKVMVLSGRGTKGSGEKWGECAVRVAVQPKRGTEMVAFREELSEGRHNTHAFGCVDLVGLTRAFVPRRSAGPLGTSAAGLRKQRGGRGGGGD